MKTFEQQKIIDLENCLLAERNTLEAVREERDAARTALKEANAALYAVGAPLGSANYFKIRGILTADTNAIPLRDYSEKSARSPKDYAIEHAECMAVNAEELIEYLNEISNEEEGTLVPDDRFGDCTSGLRSGIYEFRKRRDRFQSQKSGQGASECIDQGCPAHCAVPDGWKLVPIKASNNMMSAASQLFAKKPKATQRDYYDAMLAAAPKHIQQSALPIEVAKAVWANGYAQGHNDGIGCGHDLAPRCRHSGEKEFDERETRELIDRCPSHESEQGASE